MSSARDRSRELRSTLLSSSKSTASSTSQNINVSSIVAARVQELRQITTSVTINTATKRVYQTLVRHKRRRAMAHDLKRIPKILRAFGYRELLKAIQAGSLPAQRNPHRNLRRSKKMSLYNLIMRSKNVKRLDTHHFLSKRMKMASQWGYKIPLVTNDKSDRAVEKLQGIKATICDVSYTQVVQIDAKIQWIQAIVSLLHNYFNTYVQCYNFMHKQLQQSQSSQQRTSTSSTQSNTTHTTTIHQYPPYVLSQLKHTVFELTTETAQNGLVELPATFRYPSYDSMIFISRQLFPQLSYEVIIKELNAFQGFPWYNTINTPTTNNTNTKNTNNNTTTTNSTTTTNNNNNKQQFNTLSTNIIAPIRLQWIPTTTPTQTPSTTSTTTNNITTQSLSTTSNTILTHSQSTQTRRIWCWIHPSSSFILSTIISSILQFFQHLQCTVLKQELTSNLYIVDILRNQFSRFSIRGPKATLVLGRILQLVEDNEELIKNQQINKESDKSGENGQQLTTMDDNTTTTSTTTTSTPKLSTPHSSPKFNLPTYIEHQSKLQTITQLHSTYTNTQSHSEWTQLHTQSTNASPYITPNRLLSLNIIRPDLLKNIQKQPKSTQLSTTTSLLRRTQVSGSSVKIDKALCVNGQLDASFNKSKVIKGQNGQIGLNGQNGQNSTNNTNIQSPATFMSAGQIMNVNNQPSTKMTFISAQWTPITSSSHPNRQFVSTNEKTNEKMTINDTNTATTTTQQSIQRQQLIKSTTNNDGNDVNSTNNGKNGTNNGLGHNTPNNIISPLFDTNLRQLLIDTSPGNIAVINTLSKTRVDVNVFAQKTISSIENIQIDQMIQNNKNNNNKNISPIPSISSQHNNKMKNGQPQPYHPQPIQLPRLLPSTTTNVIIIARGPNHGPNSTNGGHLATPHHSKQSPMPILHTNYTPTSNPTSQIITNQLQYGWDIIIPLGWGKEILTSAVKRAGCVLVGVEQHQKLQLESNDIISSFPHPMTYPNSFGGNKVTMALRWTELINKIRFRRFKYGSIASYGALGPQYPSLFQLHNIKSMNNDAPTALPLQIQNESKMSDEGSSHTTTIASTTSTTNVGNGVYIGHPLLIDPDSQLKLMSQIRTWLIQLGRFHRSTVRNQRRNKARSLGRYSIHKNNLKKNGDDKNGDKNDGNNGVMTTMSDSITTIIKQPSKKSSIKTIGQSVGNGMKNDEKSEKKVKKMKKLKIHQKSICPISKQSLALFSINELPPLPRLDVDIHRRAKHSTQMKNDSATKRIKNESQLSIPTTSTTQLVSLTDGIVNGNHNNNNNQQQKPNHNKLQSIPINHSTKQQKTSLFTPYITSTRRPLSLLLKLIKNNNILTLEEKIKVESLLTNPSSPLFFPPFIWLHKRTFQNKILLKPLVPILKRITNNNNNATNTNTITNISNNNNITTNTKLQLQMNNELMIDNDYNNNNSQYEYFNFNEMHQYNTNILFQNDYNVIDNIYFHYPLLLNTKSSHVQQYQQHQQHSNDNKNPFYTEMIKINPSYTSLPIQIQSQIQQHAIVYKCNATQWYEQYSWLINIMILYSILHYDTTINNNINNNDNDNDGTIILPLIQQLKRKLLFPIHCDQLSLGHMSENGVITIPSIDDLRVIYNIKDKKNINKLNSIITQTTTTIPPTTTTTPSNQTKKVKKSFTSVKLNESIQKSQQSNEQYIDEQSQQQTEQQLPIGYLIHSHHSIKLGKVYGVGFMTEYGLLSILNSILRTFQFIPTIIEYQSIIQLLSTNSIHNDNNNNNNNNNQPIQQSTQLPFDLSNIYFPLSIHGISNKKLTWGSIKIY